jgi:hypothetical protein
MMGQLRAQRPLKQRFLQPFEKSVLGCQVLRLQAAGKQLVQNLG